MTEKMKNMFTLTPSAKPNTHARTHISSTCCHPKAASKAKSDTAMAQFGLYVNGYSRHPGALRPSAILALKRGQEMKLLTVTVDGCVA